MNEHMSPASETALSREILSLCEAAHLVVDAIDSDGAGTFTVCFLKADKSDAHVLETLKYFQRIRGTNYAVRVKRGNVAWQPTERLEFRVQVKGGGG